jgi:hypothetical protein
MYAAEGLHQALERVWTRVQKLFVQLGRKKLVIKDGLVKRIGSKKEGPIS